MAEKPARAPAEPDPRLVAEYHVHVYYDPAKTRRRAERLRERIAAEFPQAKIGRWHDKWSVRIRSRCIRSRFQAASCRHCCPG